MACLDAVIRVAHGTSASRDATFLRDDGTFLAGDESFCWNGDPFDWNSDPFTSGRESSGGKHDPLAWDSASSLWKRGSFLWNSDPLGWNRRTLVWIDAREMETDALAQSVQEIDRKLDRISGGSRLYRVRGQRGAAARRVRALVATFEEPRISMTMTKKTTQSKSIPQSNPQAAPPAAAPPTAVPPTPATPPDPNASLEQYVQETVAELDTVEVGLGNDPALTPAQKRHALKFRKGGDKIIAQIGNLAQQQQLESPGLNVTDMMGTLGKAQALAPLSDRVHAFAKHVDDVVFKAESDSLAMAQQFYALLRRRSLMDAELRTAMAPVVGYFARKPVPKAPGALTKPQKKATAKAVDTLKKNAPQMLQDGAPAVQGQAAPAATAPAAGGTGAAASGNGAAAPAAPTGVGHS